MINSASRGIVRPVVGPVKAQIKSVPSLVKSSPTTRRGALRLCVAMATSPIIEAYVKGATMHLTYSWLHFSFGVTQISRPVSWAPLHRIKTGLGPDTSIRLQGSQKHMSEATVSPFSSLLCCWKIARALIDCLVLGLLRSVPGWMKRVQLRSGSAAGLQNIFLYACAHLL